MIPNDRTMVRVEGFVFQQQGWRKLLTADEEIFKRSKSILVAFKSLATQALPVEGFTELLLDTIVGSVHAPAESE